jgi:mycothiol synthase
MTINERKLPGLYMLWPGSRLAQPPLVELPAAYIMRTYTADDDPALINLLSIGEAALTEKQWQDYKDRLLPNGLFLIVHRESQAVVATAGAGHNPNPGRYYFPFGGELGYLAVHPSHRGQGLGRIISARVVKRLLAAGYASIRVGVQGFRLPAIKTYLKVGFVPFLHHEDLCPRWERICNQLQWPFMSETWPKTLHENSVR